MMGFWIYLTVRWDHRPSNTHSLDAIGMDPEHFATVAAPQHLSLFGSPLDSQVSFNLECGGKSGCRGQFSKILRSTVFQPTKHFGAHCFIWAFHDAHSRLTEVALSEVGLSNVGLTASDCLRVARSIRRRPNRAKTSASTGLFLKWSACLLSVSLLSCVTRAVNSNSTW